MRRALACVGLLLLAGCGGGGEPKTGAEKVEVVKPAAAPQRTSEFDSRSIYRTEAPGVVTLISLDATGGKKLFGRSRRALGSGFVVDTNGYIATNAHVVTGDSGKKAQHLYV